MNEMKRKKVNKIMVIILKNIIGDINQLNKIDIISQY